MDEKVIHTDQGIRNITVKDLKDILNTLPDDMPIVIPVVDENYVNRIYGFRYARTAGILSSETEEQREVLCLNGATPGEDIADQIYDSGRSVNVEKVFLPIKIDCL